MPLIATFGLIILMLIGTLVPMASRADGLECRSIFNVLRSKPPQYGQFREDFEHNTDYKILVPDQSEIKNQCQLGTCHIHSWVSELEQSYKARTHQDLKLSTHYLSAHHWLAKSLELLESEDLQANAGLGANVFTSRRAILKYGLIPDEVWTSTREFQTNPVAGRLKQYIINITANAKLKSSQEVDPAKKQALIDEAKKNIIGVFENQLGHFPSHFQFLGKDYSPQTFAQDFFPELRRPVINLQFNTVDNSTILTGSSSDGANYKTNIELIESIAKKNLDQGLNIYLSYEHNGQYIQPNFGIMSIDAFHSPPGAEPLTRQQRDEFNIRDGGHAVQIVGYDADPETGKVLKWKMKNSWGEKAGDQGYFHMYDDYFRTFVNSISYFGDSGIPVPVMETPKLKKKSLLDFFKKKNLP
jgi:bleomycin hydrolase